MGIQNLEDAKKLIYFKIVTDAKKIVSPVCHCCLNAVVLDNYKGVSHIKLTITSKYGSQDVLVHKEAQK